MRTETEMLELILGVAAHDPNIRIVAMNGSRTNALVPKDRWQDFDIVFVVDEIKPLLESRSWIDQFGERLIMQTPGDMEPQRWFTFLMQFVDGNRIDLMIVPLDDLEMYLRSDKLLKILLDKDSLISGTLPATDEDYWIKRPSAKEFNACINEFLWVSMYVVKGLKRGELIYAMDHISIMRDMLLQMMAWRVGYKTEYKISIGKNYKLLKLFVEEDLWNRLMQTYNLGAQELVWDALDTLITTFEIVCDRVADTLNFAYNRQEFHNVTKVIYRMREGNENDAFVL
ncbi:aminoglycoside 6-adenylyltransferase [Erysipelothrix sp. HDW6C]|uniref:aminoglycoside 6-adenylyltransferase n=1 Tax=Erysipelothrix sp. HDW6C TaxID=2714930 RepID=UPI001407DB6A|nr:aminoglycoside 6-adenylyltransferase [Erysipelothrix sp. HDW6C]QIK68877.1 aminoglycoside 6-adenylyltransferase [Erysipelothrix sp. HDW6C]